MPDVCLAFIVHHAERLRHVRVFDQETRIDSYVDGQATAADLRRVANAAFLPALRLLREVAEKSEGRLRFGLAPTGPFLRSAQAHYPALLKALQRLETSGVVEWIATPADYSILSVIPEYELAPMLARQADLIESLFGTRPTTAANTEFIYDNRVAAEAAKAGMHTVLPGYADRQLSGRSANRLYAAAGGAGIRLLARNVGLSDDWGVRFSDREWPCHPLTAETYASWIRASLETSGGEVCPLYLHLRDLGVTHDQESGIFTFTRRLLKTLLKSGVRFVTPSELSAPAAEPPEMLDVPQATSSCGPHFDLSPWLGNAMQCNALRLLQTASGPNRARLERDERLLPVLAADHLWHMRYSTLGKTGSRAERAGTGGASDAETRRRCSPFDSPYEAYLDYTNALRHATGSRRA